MNKAEQFNKKVRPFVHQIFSAANFHPLGSTLLNVQQNSEILHMS